MTIFSSVPRAAVAPPGRRTRGSTRLLPGASADLVVRKSKRRGRGVFSCRPLLPGELVLVFDGPVLALDQVGDFARCLQVGPCLFRGPSGGHDDYVNHSCDPNCGLVSVPDSLALVAIRPIDPDEELTFDYSTSMLDEPWTLQRCRCGTALCRGSILPYPDLPARVRRRYERLGIVPSFLLEQPGVKPGEDPSVVG